jgi:ABC-type Fe3+-siderophore transport system permease subunit
MSKPAIWKMSKDEFEAKLEMTKAFADTAKSYVQISSAGLALPLLFTQAIFGKNRADGGLLGACPWTLIASWAFFVLAIAFGLTYQWLSIRRIWDQFHQANRTPENASQPGYRTTRWVIRMDRLNLSLVWLGMVGGFYAAAVLFTIFARAHCEGMTRLRVFDLQE